jgi:hypothetical protein
MMNDQLLTAIWIAVVALALANAAFRLVRSLQRRARLRTFAAANGLRFRGMIPSDKYLPYTQFGIVSWAVVLANVMEGRWNDFDIAVFDYPQSRSVRCTGVIVTLLHDATQFQLIPGDSPIAIRSAVGQRSGDWTHVALDIGLAPGVVVREAQPGSAAAGIGRRTAEALRSGPPVFVETNFGYVLVRPMRKLDADQLPEFLGFVSALGRALDSDAQLRSAGQQPRLL